MLNLNTQTVRNSLFSLLALLFVICVPVNATESSDFSTIEKLLMSNDFQDKGKAITLLGKRSNAAEEGLLQRLLDSQLYYHKKDKKLVIIESFEEGAKATSLSGLAEQITRKRDYKKVVLNNQLRNQIHRILAEIGLNAPVAAERLDSARGLLKDLSPDTIDLLRQRFAVEDNKSVKEVLQVALAINQLKQPDIALQSQAIKQLSGSLEQEARASLVAYIQQAESPALKKQAQIALKSIEDKVQYFAWLETFYFGLSLGSVLVLAGIGLAITFGVMGVINMAHGELIMIGAYTTYVIQQLMPNHIGLSIIVAIPAAFVVSGLVGIAIERGVIRFLYGRPLETLLATFGISLILQQAVRSIFSPLNRSVETPEWMSGLIEINPVFALTESRLYIILFCLVVFVLLSLVLKKTPLGLQVRAVSQNRAMAQAMGVRSNRVDALTFGLGSGVAGIAGVALSQLTNVGPNLGQAYIIDSFMVVVFGGVGNLWGTLVAGLSLGVANKIMEPWAGAVLAKILVLVFIILFIQKRPRGLFPQRGRAAEG